MSYLLVQTQGQTLDVTISNTSGNNAIMYADAALTQPITLWPQRLNGVDTMFYVGRDTGWWNVTVKEYYGNTILSQLFQAGYGMPATVSPVSTPTQNSSRAGKTYMEANAVSVCEETIPRLVSGGTLTLTTGVARFSAFTARSSLIVNNITYVQAGTAAAGLTTNRVALYSVDTFGNITFIQSGGPGGATVTASTTVVVPLLGPVTLIPGARYAIGILYAGTTLGMVYGQAGGSFLSVRIMDIPWSAAELAATDLTAAALASATYGTLTGRPAVYMRVS